MSFYNKFKTGLFISLLSILPIHYNINLLKYYSFLVCLVCYYEFYNNVLLNSNNYILIMISLYWLLFPCIIINYLINLKDIWNIILITIFSDCIQQISNKVFIIMYNKKDDFYNLMLYHPFNLSPKKTVIGYLGGLNTVLLYYYFIQYIIELFFMLYVCGCIGDLTASYFKRIKNIDDYSNYLGSHGGFLDRFDSLLFNVHFFYSYLVIFKLV